MSDFDPIAVRSEFPILSREIAGKPLTYLDNGATSQKPARVIEAIDRFYRNDNANIHRGIHYLSREATEAYEEARDYIKSCLKLPASHEAIFVRGTTEGINLVTHGLTDQLQEGDEIVLSIMEHHANFVPWQVLAEQKKLTVRYVGLAEHEALDLAEWKNAFSEKTKVASFAHISNVLGTVNPVEEMVEFARERGVLSLVDGAQAVPHGPVDLGGISPDFYVFSGHKMFGPDGIGILCGPRDLLNSFPPYQTGGDMIDRVSVEGTTFRDVPERFEAGTPNISGVIGLAEAFRFVSDIDWEAAHKHEAGLVAHATEALESFPGLRIFGTTPGKAAIISYLMDSVHPHDIGSVLDTEGVAIRVGHHCAQPLMDYLKVPATARASFALYNTHDDVESLLSGMRKVVRFFA